MKPSNDYTNLSFLVPMSIKEQFALLCKVYGKKDGEMFLMLVEQALAKPISNTRLRTLPPEIRRAALIRQSEQAEKICRLYADDLALDDPAG